MWGHLGACKCLHVCNLGLYAGLPVWGALGVCLDRSVSVWACLCLSARFLHVRLCVGLSGCEHISLWVYPSIRASRVCLCLWVPGSTWSRAISVWLSTGQALCLHSLT